MPIFSTSSRVIWLYPFVIKAWWCEGFPAHYWAREIERLGHQVSLMSLRFVTPYRKGNKNYPNHAEAICEAVTRPSMRFCPSSVMKSRTCRELRECENSSSKTAPHWPTRSEVCCVSVEL
jgi:hypothetical protein